MSVIPAQAGIHCTRSSALSSGNVLLDHLSTPSRPGILPAVGAEVLLEGDETRMLPSQVGDVGLVAVIVEPPVHDGELLAHLLLEVFPGYLEVVDLASDYPRERIGDLGHGQLVPSEVYLAPYPLVLVLEGHGGEDTYILDRDHLERLLGVERLGER